MLRAQADYPAARQANEEALAILAELGDQASSIWTIGHCNLGNAVHREGDCTRAASLFIEALNAAEKLGHKQQVALNILGLAGVAGTLKQPERAARLFGAAEKLLDTLGAKLWPADRLDYEHNLEVARTQLAEDQFEQARQEGRAMTLEQAVFAARELAAAVPVQADECAMQTTISI